MEVNEIDRINQVKVPLAKEDVEEIREVVKYSNYAHLLFMADDTWRYDDFILIDSYGVGDDIWFSLSHFIDALCPEVGHLDLRKAEKRQDLADIFGVGKTLDCDFVSRNRIWRYIPVLSPWTSWKRERFIGKKLEEKDYLAADVIGVLGRGVELRKGNSVNVGAYKPTSLTERQTAGQHSGIRDLNVNPDDPDSNVVIAGGNSNVLGTVEYIEQLHYKGMLPHSVVFAAGRPKYLANAPVGISEGAVMEDKLKNALISEGIRNLDTRIFTQNTNTLDDVKSVLNFTVENRLNSVVLISIGPHLGRVREFVRIVLKNNWEKYRDIEDIRIVDSWALLEKRDELYEKILNSLEGTLAMRRTEERELAGLLALRAGTYRSIQDK